MKTSSIPLIGLLLTGALGALCLAPLSHADEPKPAPKFTREQEEFFETKVRPALFANCFGCHADQQQMGGLRLDSLEHIRAGNSGGPAVIPGEPDKSPLIQAIRYDGKVKMPPSGKLKPEEIAALTEWVKVGAPWPAKTTAGTGAVADKTTDAKKHWSFQPVRRPALPRVTDAAWVKTPIDRFILAKLEAKGLKPSPPADRLTLIRRVTFDLIGLPPTPQEVSSYLADKSPNAFAKVVDRLLADPRYGERWGRHWLDVARYADTKGYSFTEDPKYYNAYTYRDWVVRAFNEDLPYDKFLIDQLAADRLPRTDDRRSLAALGFLTVGRRFLNDPVFINDDRIDVTCRGLMGLTVACARCHDHKFDPIPTKDYYSLYGIFASAQEVSPAISPKSIRDPYDAQNAKLQQAEAERDNLIRGQVARLRTVAAQSAATTPAPVKAVLQALREDALPDGGQLAALEPRFEAPARETLKKHQQAVETLRKTMPPKPEQAMGLEDLPTPFEPHVFRRGNSGNQGDAVPRQFLAVLSGPNREPYKDGGRLELAEAIANKDNPLTARVLVNRVWMNHFGNGLVRTPGDFGMRGEPPTHPELLDWLASEFVQPTAKFDSGPKSETRGVKDDMTPWSIKRLHRMMLLSGAYRQRSDFNPRAFAVDPENRLLWCMNRQRLDLEALRDSLLFVSGALDPRIGGPAVEITTADYAKRRTIYGFIDRQNLQGLYRTFDFASPDTSTPMRFHTTIPQQALFMMNSPFVMDQAKSLAKRVESEGKTDDGRIAAVYRTLFGRAPTADETKQGLAYVRRPATPDPNSAWRYGYGVYDEKTQRVVEFSPLTVFTGASYQGGAQFPDARLQFLQLTANGGHPGIDAAHAAIRRWIAPADGTITIDANLSHDSAQGDGVQGRIVSSGKGLLGSWAAFHGSRPTPLKDISVRKGDTIDFVVDCRAENSFDSFQWNPTIRLIPFGTRLTAHTEPPTWNAASDFGAPNARTGLNSWEKYCQALLMTNEFTFLD